MQAAASIVPALTPPSTPRTHHLANVDTGMQTDDSFDVETAALVEHLALSALARASESLQNEEEIERLRQKAKTSEERLVALQSSTDHQLLNNMLSSLQRDEQLRFSRRLAKETCRAVTSSSLAHLRELEQQAALPRTRSIGLDTRVAAKPQQSLMIVELEKDFFPWIFARAERKFRRAMLSVQLQTANMAIRRGSFVCRANFARV